jgi:hypothetical protein
MNNHPIFQAFRLRSLTFSYSKVPKQLL